MKGEATFEGLHYLKNLADMLAAADEFGLAWATYEESWPGLDSGFNHVPHGPSCVYN